MDGEVQRATRARYWVVVFAVTLAIIQYIDRVCISKAMPSIQKDLHFSNVQAGYIFSAFTLAYALFEIPGGWLGDSFGTRKALARVVVCWSIFTALTGATTGFVSLLVVRFLFGVGEAGAYPNAALTVSRWFPSSSQSRAISVAFVGTCVGG